jgi:cell wall-associated NlpC family hydrolase
VNTIAWVLILGGILVLRAVSRGRVLNIGEDLSDAFLAGVAGDGAGVAEVLARTGDSGTASGVGPSTIKAWEGTPAGHEDGSANLNSTAVTLGAAAKGYRLGATGPDWYDCSGLVYRAVQKFGYKGDRFTTDNVLSKPGFKKVPKEQATTGDIVLWPTHHMGVINDPVKGTFYSARNPRSGIGIANIKGFRSEDPVYVKFYPNG